jgi:hypothetical protein
MRYLIILGWTLIIILAELGKWLAAKEILKVIKL